MQGSDNRHDHMSDHHESHNRQWTLEARIRSRAPPLMCQGNPSHFVAFCMFTKEKLERQGGRLFCRPKNSAIPKAAVLRVQICEVLWTARERGGIRTCLQQHSADVLFPTWRHYDRIHLVRVQQMRQTKSLSHSLSTKQHLFETYLTAFWLWDSRSRQGQEMVERQTFLMICHEVRFIFNLKA